MRRLRQPARPAELIRPRSALSGDIAPRRARKPAICFCARARLLPALSASIDAEAAGRPSWHRLPGAGSTSELKDRSSPAISPGHSRAATRVRKESVLRLVRCADRLYRRHAGMGAGRARSRLAAMVARRDDVRYIQFLGKDNVPFHAVSFPATLIGSSEPGRPSTSSRAFTGSLIRRQILDEPAARRIHIPSARRIPPICGAGG